MRIVLALCAVLAGFFLTACTDDTPDYRYRLTVEVATPQGVRTGSSVIEVETSVASATTIPSPGAVSHRVRGQAVAVDLPGGRTLFALLRSEDDSDWASRVMFLLAPEGRNRDGDLFLGTYANMLKLEGPITLPRTWKPSPADEERSHYPMLVTFGDPGDPTSVQLVDPVDLAKTFGPGTALRRITVEMTDDAVTEGIEGRLGWLRTARGAIGPLPLSERPPLGTALPLHATLSETAFHQGGE